MAPDSTDDENSDPPPYIRFRISSERKREWLEYLEDSTHSTLTDLIKTSVNNTISGTWVLETDETTSDVPSDLADSIDGINDRLEVIETQLDDAAVSDVEPTDELNEQELMRIARQCHDVLPVVQDEEHLLSMTPLREFTIEPETRSTLTGTAQDISKHIDEPQSAVRRSLIYLERQQTARVDSTIDDGTRRWFEVNPNVERSIPSDIELEDSVKEELGIEDVSNALEFVDASDPDLDQSNDS